MTEYCYHCGGELADGAHPMIFPSDLKQARPRPGIPCKCEEISPQYDKYQRSSYPNWNHVSKNQEKA